MPKAIKSVIPSGAMALLIIGGFGYGLMSTTPPENVLNLAMPKPEVVEVDPQEVEKVELEYIFIKTPISATVPKFDARLQIKISIAHDTKLASIVVDLIKEAPDKLVAELAEEFRLLANDAEDLDVLYETVPPVFLNTLNAILGDDDIPQPIHEVFISSLLKSQ